MNHMGLIISISVLKIGNNIYIYIYCIIKVVSRNTCTCTTYIARTLYVHVYLI